MSMLRKKIGNFYLVELIGSGGLAEVYLGINPRTRARRAFKILGKRSSIPDSVYARFRREAESMRDLSHPGIIRIRDSGVLEDFSYYSMEFMPGGNLAMRLGRGKIPITRAAALFAPLCDAMAYAHEQSVTHRDLKPSNILFTAAGDPVISDFGIAKVLDLAQDAMIHSGDILGAIAYLAPEQRFNSGSVSRGVDVYALGAMLYEMVMGFPPLGRFPWPREVHPEFPETVQTVLQKCLATNPDSRFEHAGYLKTEIGKIPELGQENKSKIMTIPAPKASVAFEIVELAPIETDRIETWFSILRTGATRERLAVVREMTEKITSAEAKAIMKLYPEESDHVRWGLIRVLGELKIEAATKLILCDLHSSYHADCAIEALGKIGSVEAYNPIREFVVEHPESAASAMLPMARTGKERAIKDLSGYLAHETAAVRQAAVTAIASIASMESLHLIKEHLCIERDDNVRSSLNDAIHSLQSLLAPVIAAAVHTNISPCAL
jgi:serine/threonine protein kinase